MLLPEMSSVMALGSDVLYLLVILRLKSREIHVRSQLLVIL